jgi:AGCS family alanine or glycine:cation symporter
MLIFGIILMILVGIIVIGGLQRIAAVAEKVVPFMVVAFILGSLIIIFKNFTHIGGAFAAIFRSAFTPKAAWGAAGGVALKQVITMGCKRGVFSNEAGLGSSVMVHSNSNVVEPVKQGLWGIFEVFADTIVVCTMTALTILTSGVIDLSTGAAVTDSDSTLVAEAFNTVFSIGDLAIGRYFIAIAILLFSFTTVLGWSHYGSKAIEYLAGAKSQKAVKIYKVIFVLMIISGAVLTSSLAWDISDTFNGMMMIPNLIGVISLAPLVRKITKSYVNRRIKGIKEEPILSFFPEINEQNAKKIAETGED